MQFCKRSFSSALKITVQKIESFASDGHSGRDFVDKCLICKRELNYAAPSRSGLQRKRKRKQTPLNMKRLSFCVRRLLLKQALLDLAMIEFTSLSFRFCDLTLVEKLPVQLIPDAPVRQLNHNFFLAIFLAMSKRFYYFSKCLEIKWEKSYDQISLLSLMCHLLIKSQK